MRHRARIPRAPLDGFVALIWLYEGVSRAHARESVLPSGTTELVINLGEDETRVYDDHDCRRLPGALVVGAHARPFVIDTAEQAAVIGAHFHAGGAVPFLGVDAGSLRDRHVPLECLWGVAAVRRLRQQLLESRAPESRLSLLERALVARLRRPPARHPAVAHALGALDGGGVGVQTIVAEAGYSARRFISLFTDEVGLTPKLYQRVRRFQRLLDRIRHGRRDWVTLALDSGFFDQAHLIRDFREFSGLTPRRYLASGGEWQNHVPIR
jgi:AraC-like DNA-binding protein